MDIHRCRFVPYPPSTINALALSHSHISKDQKTAPPRLAVGRANGDIEIWNPLKGSWLQETIIHGGKDRSIDGLAWIQDPNEEVQGKTIVGRSRLFSIGYTTTVTEWDLEKGRPLRQASGNHGEIWCLAAQPALTPMKNEANSTSSGQWQGQNLIAGCTDGALVLYSTKDDGLELQKVLVRPSSKKAKIVSITFQDQNIVVAGCSDSTIRIYDIRNGQTLRSMTLGTGLKGGPKEMIVWSVKVLKNGNIISGDSTGELKIWDGKTYTMMQRIKSHKQDVLSLATSADGSTIFSGGMDRRTVVYKPVGKGKSRWEEVGHRRFHSHDVKTMTSFEGYGMSVVVSGGPDASPTVVPLGQYGFENQRSLPFLPQEPTIRSAPRKRLMMSWWDREVHIWRLSKPSKSATALEDLEDEPTAQSRKLVAKILIKGEANITSAALSTDGNLLAVSTTTDIKVFQLRARRPEEGDGLRIAKVTVPSSFSSGARLLQFSPDGKWLCIVRPDGHVVLGRISLSTSSTITINAPLSKLSRLDRQIEKFVTLGGLGTYDRIITQAAFSWDSRILAVSDLAGYIDTFVLSGTEDLTQIPSEEDASSSESASEDSDEDSDSEEEPNPKTIFGQYWTRNPSASSLPKLPSTPVILSFRPAATPSQKALTNGAVPHATRNNPHPVSHELPAGEDRLLVLTATSDVFEFEVLKGGLSAWSRRNPTAAFPEKFRMNRDQARGVIWDISPKNGKERVWLYGIGWLWMFDFSQDLPPPKSSNQLLTNGDINGENGVEAEDEEVAATPSKKRKRNIKGQRKGTGAGDAVPNHRLETGIGRKMMRVVYEEEGGTHRIIPGTSDAMDIDEDDDDADQVSALERLRRGDDAETGEEGEEEGEGEKAYDWSTLKYRPILGMCVIGERGEDDDELEVAIVERPIWEVDLPPAYYGDQEWIKKDH